MKHARLAAPLVAVLLFAGCSTPPGSTVFSVDGQRVTERQLDDTTKACARLTQSQPAALRAKVAQLMLLGRLAPAVARSAGIELTPAMQSKALAGLQAGNLVDDPACRDAVQGVANFGAVAEKLGQQRTIEAMRNLDIQVNPAYGHFDITQAALAGGSGSLSSEDLGLGKVFGG